MAHLIVGAADARSRGIQQREGTFIERGEITDLIPLTVSIPASTMDISAPYIMRDPGYVPEVGDVVVVFPMTSGEWYIAPAVTG